MEWEYHAITGQTVAKEDASGQRTEYRYNANGQLHEREWARGVVTEYLYDAMGRLNATGYSDGTPSVSLTYHRDGSLKTQTDAAGLRSFALDPLTGLPARESMTTAGGSANLLEGAVLERGYDAMARPSSLRVRNGGTVLGPMGLLAPEVSIGYTVRGRVGSVNSGNLEAAYTYNASGGHDGQGRVINRKVTGATIRLESKDRYHVQRGHYETNHRQMSTSSPTGYFTQQRNKGAPSSASAGGDLLVTGNSHVSSSTGGLSWAYGFNARGEVTSARRMDNVAQAPYSDPDSLTRKLLAGQDFGYTYDDMGNRVQQLYGGRGQEAALAADGGTVDYTVNALNQYTELENSRHLYALGMAQTTAAVEVNGVAAVSRSGSSPYGPTPADYDLPFRQGWYYSARLAASGTDAAWVPVSKAQSVCPFVSILKVSVPL